MIDQLLTFFVHALCCLPFNFWASNCFAATPRVDPHIAGDVKSSLIPGLQSSHQKCELHLFEALAFIFETVIVSIVAFRRMGVLSLFY